MKTCITCSSVGYQDGCDPFCLKWARAMPPSAILKPRYRELCEAGKLDDDQAAVAMRLTHKAYLVASRGQPKPKGRTDMPCGGCGKSAEEKAEIVSDAIMRGKELEGLFETA